MKAAINFPGYALIDILQPCVSFNKINTHGWYKNRVYYPEIDDQENFNRALELAGQWGEKIPLGVFYNKPRPTFESAQPALTGEPLAFRSHDPRDFSGLQKEFF